MIMTVFLLSLSTNPYESWHGYTLILDHLNGVVYRLWNWLRTSHVFRYYW
jgi:hypothetical protein